MITAEEIRNAEFSKAGINGFKSVEVNELLEDAANALDMLEHDKAELIKKIQVLADKIEEYRGMEDTLKTSIFHSQKTADTILKEAKDKAEQVVMEAEIKAEEMVKTAKAEAEKTAAEAEASAKTVVAEAEAKAATLAERTEQCISTELDTYSLIKDRVASFRATVLQEYKNHVNMISSITADDRAIEKQAEQIEKAKEPGEFEAKFEINETNETNDEINETNAEIDDSLFVPMA